MATKRVAVVTGANKGIGFEVSRQLARQGMHVVLTARDEAKGQAAARKLAGEGLDVEFFPLDVTSDASVGKLKRHLEEKTGRVDVLVNNAGVFPDSGWSEGGNPSVFSAKVDALREGFETNTLGPFRVSQALVPLMRKNRYGRVVNVSSGMGQLSEMEGSYPGYRVSKTALNALTRVFSEESKEDGVKVNSVCPGWVKTDMGGAEAERTPEEGARGIVFLATLPDNGPTGGFFRDGERIEW